MLLPRAPTNALILGDTRAGKTTGTGRWLLTNWLRPAKTPRGVRRWFRRRVEEATLPPGFLALCVKNNEADGLTATLTHAGRASDIIRVTLGGPWRCDPLALYFGLRGASPAEAAKLVAVLTHLADRSDGNRGEAFWRQAAEKLVFYSLVALAAAYGRPTFGQLYRFIRSLPYGAADIAGGTYQTGFAGETMTRAVASAPARYAAAMTDVVDFVTRNWTLQPDKLRESVREVALTSVFPFTVAPVAELCDGDTLKPELLDGGACVLLDVPVVRHRTEAVLWMSAVR